MGSRLESNGAKHGAESVAGRSVTPGVDCRSCDLRSRCITYGWRSPGGLWFENTVVLRPARGCRGWIGRSADILGHFGELEPAPRADDDPPPPAGEPLGNG